MKIKITLGKTEFILDENKEMEGLHKGIVLGNPPRVCDICKGTTLKLDSNKDKDGNVYVNVVCSCGAKAKLGQYKAGGYFWKTFEVYKKNNAVNIVKNAVDGKEIDNQEPPDDDPFSEE